MYCVDRSLHRKRYGFYALIESSSERRVAVHRCGAAHTPFFMCTGTDVRTQHRCIFEYKLARSLNK
mgnify:CR=1 FL=1